MDNKIDAETTVLPVLPKAAPMHNNNVCAIIVTYNPTDMLLENVSVLRPQVDRLVIIDNGSGDVALNYVERARREFDCQVIFNRRNLGVAAALNIGIHLARSQDADWVALFDQDSSVDGSFVASMLCAYYECENPEKIAIITPQTIDKASSTPLPPLTGSSDKILACMTSGSLIPLRSFTRCGAFNETLFIDYVDHEFCLRVRSMGFEILQSKSATLLHSLGGMTFHSILGRNLPTTNHGAARRYYMTRNRVWLYQRYMLEDLPWSLRDAWAMFTETVKVVLLEEDRVLKVRSILLGVRDGLCGAMGNRMPL